MLVLQNRDAGEDHRHECDPVPHHPGQEAGVRGPAEPGRGGRLHGHDRPPGPNPKRERGGHQAQRLRRHRQPRHRHQRVPSRPWHQDAPRAPVPPRTSRPLPSPHFLLLPNNI